MNASLIFINARVMTMDADRPHAQALAVAGNRILAIGDEDSVRVQAGPDTRIIYAGGTTLMPGFVESHVHIFSGAYGQTLLQLSEIKGFDAMKSAVESFAAARPAEGLLFHKGRITKSSVAARVSTAINSMRCVLTGRWRSWLTISIRSSPTPRP